MALGTIFIWTYAYSLIRSASHIHEQNEFESGSKEKIPNIDYLNVVEKSNLLQIVQIVPEVPNSGGNHLSHQQSGCNMIRFSSLPKDFNLENAVGVILNDNEVRTKPCGVFGSFGWSGEAVDEMEQRLKDGGFSFSFPSIRCKFKECYKFVKKVGQTLQRL